MNQGKSKARGKICINYDVLSEHWQGFNIIIIDDVSGLAVNDDEAMLRYFQQSLPDCFLRLNSPTTWQSYQ